MVGSKSTKTRMVGIIDKMHPYTIFPSNRVSMIVVQGCTYLELTHAYPKLL